jgi:hypothetical protein
MSLIFSSTERFPSAVQHVQDITRRERCASWREIQSLPLPLIVNADLVVGKNDLTRCNQVK